MNLFTQVEYSNAIEDTVIKPLYQTFLRFLVTTCLDINVVLAPNMETNSDVWTAEAERLYYNCSYKECLELTES